MTDRIQANLGVLQGLTSFTDKSGHEQHQVSIAHSRRTLDTVTEGLGGSARQAAFHVGEERDTDFGRIRAVIEALFDSNSRSMTEYDNSRVETQKLLNTHEFGVFGIITGRT